MKTASNGNGQIITFVKDGKLNPINLSKKIS